MSDIPPSFSSSSSGGLDGLGAQTSEAAAAFTGLGDSAKDAAAAIDAAFTRAGESLTKTLAKAAVDGKLSLSGLASAAISAIEVFARSSDGQGGTLTGALASAISGVFGGARADGGPVSAGGAYLVGERGPEVFRPASGGEIAPASAAGGGAVVNVTIQGGGAPALLRSEAQIAASLARAVSLGAR